MSQQLYIEFNSQTVDFQAGGYILLDGFYPEAATDPNKPVTDRATVLVVGSSLTDLENKIRAVNRALDWARTHPRAADGAWLYYAVSEDLDAWRALITDGVVMLDGSLGNKIREFKARITVVIEHTPYWDGPEAQIPLSNANGLGNTSGLPVYNCNDGSGSAPTKRVNYADVDGADVGGDLPGPTRLEILNTYASGNLYDVWIGQNVTDPTHLNPILEGEAASGGNSISNSGSSGGSYRKFDLYPGAETEMFTWTLSSTVTNACQGAFYKFLLRFASGAAYLPYVRFQLKLKWNLTTIWQSGQVIPDNDRAICIRDLFTARIPPWLIGQSGLDEVDLVLTGQQSAGYTMSLGLDFMQITPADGFRHVMFNGYGAPQNYRIVDDGINELLYVDAGDGSAKAGVLVGYQAPIRLHPGIDQRLYFLMHSNAANQAEIARRISVKLFHSPRRSSL